MQSRSQGFEEEENCVETKLRLHIVKNFPLLGIPNVHGLIPNFKPYLVVKIIDI
jgi:hypothetical protein